ncbi:TonB family protein / TonB-dependent receptor [Sandaracinus amylolyticus]|uniref:TonB family protein / TonB-dependent receptor n=1 Tax=Sandaracinus amylolyticus TaxID=927083 RepID=A0A0F6W181_9BACT|nr:TonB family protein / TonB-dependent receptor [Sandaracinus amylolyticus]
MCGRPRGWLASLLFALAVVVANAAHVKAQDAPADDAPARPSPPRLTQFVPSDPPEGLEDRDAAVLLEITVTAEGTVSDVRVVEGAGEGLEAFDERAMTAARVFVFEPARVGERAIGARIRYRYVFEARVVEEQIEPAAEGDAEAETETETETEAEGESAAEAESETEADAPEDPEPVFRARAEVEPSPRDAVRRVLRREVLTRMPGTRGDALRVVELLPGVGRPAFGGGVLLVRGSAPGDSQVFLDGNPVPLLYHFGGLTSFFNSQLLQRIEFVPGNFSVRYGRKIGGILEVDPRDPRFDGFHGFIDLSGGIDASIMLEGPIDEDFAFALAFRRSYIDAVLALAQDSLGDDAPDFLTAPVYYDYQALATWTPTDADRIRLAIYGSSDELRLLLANPSDGDFAVRGNLGISTQFHRIQIGWRHVEGWLEQDVQVGFGVNLLELGVGDAFQLDGEFLPLNIRSEWRMQLSPSVRTIVGMDMQITPLSLLFRGPPTAQSEGMPAMPTDERIDFAIDDVVAYRPAAYVETDVTLFERLDLVLGVRADYYREIEELTVDPRMTARVRLTDQIALRTGVGLFSQPPEFQESVEDLGNPDLEPIHALHVGLGGDLRLPEHGMSFSLDGFYKHLWDRVVATPRGVAPFFTNDGLGRIYGLEVAARMEPDGPYPLFGFLSYTLSRSERQDGPGQEWRLFDFDQTHILTLALVWRIGQGWELGGTFRLVSGNPYTPIGGAIQDVRTSTYRPIYGAVNSDRNPFFHRLDVRLQKLWRIGDVSLTFYIDVQNVYNSTNPEGRIYNYDYSESRDLPGLPILPSIGIRGEL